MSLLLFAGCGQKDEAPEPTELNDVVLLNGTYTFSDGSQAAMSEGKNESGQGGYYEVRSAGLYDVTGDARPDGVVLIKKSSSSGFLYELIVAEDDSGRIRQIAAARLTDNLEVTMLTFDSVDIHAEVQSSGGAKEVYIYTLKEGKLIRTNTPELMNFRCMGTEPFWSIVIRDGSIQFLTPDNPDGEQWKFTPPVVSAEKWVYTTMDAKNRNVTITITKGKCSDGMSETEFSYRSAVKLGTINLNGCARDLNEN
jgi:uncharacterized membrane protein